MAKWRIWQDDYWGTDWNDRSEISYPQFEGQEFSSPEEVEERLLSYYAEGARGNVVVDGDDEQIQAQLCICGECDEVWPCEKHGELEDDEQPVTYIGYHAELVA